MRKFQFAAIFTTIFLFIFVTGVVMAQDGGAQLHISEIDVSAFPAVIFRLEALDNENNSIVDLQGLTLSEDGQPITEFESRPLDVGVELYFVIDADSNIEDRDEAGGLSRREKVRDSIVRYADRFMDPTQLDRATIIVPEGSGSRFLDRPNMTFPNEVINAANFYLPDELEEVPLNRMLSTALDEAVRSSQDGRFQAIVLFTDAADLSDQIDLETFLTRAQEQNVAVFPVILGSRADTHEIEQANLLAEPTKGYYVHMPDPTDTDTLYARLQQRGILSEVSYRSGLNSSGTHVIGAELGGSRGEADIDIVVEPPIVNMAIDNSRPILRVATDSETPIELIEPTMQPLVAQVQWPDHHPRALIAASLLVGGQEQTLDGSVLGADGILTFEWDISTLEAGVYNLQVQVIDELGLVGVSEPLPLAIEIQRPVAVPAATPTVAPAPTSRPTTALVDDESQSQDRIVVAVAGVVLFIALMVILIVLLLLLRSRRSETGAEAPVAPSVQAPSAPVPPLAGEPDPNVTQFVSPQFVTDEVGAYLEVLENAPEHPGLIPISGNNVTLGRDPNRAAIPFKDRSVSRLHARILESHSTYRIYDEGSSSGTFVNYERVTLTPRTLQDKDQIHFGRVHLRFHLASSLPAAARSSADSDGTETEFYESP